MSVCVRKKAKAVVPCFVPLLLQSCLSLPGHCFSDEWAISIIGVSPYTHAHSLTEQRCQHHTWFKKCARPEHIQCSCIHSETFLLVHFPPFLLLVNPLANCVSVPFATSLLLFKFTLAICTPNMQVLQMNAGSLTIKLQLSNAGKPNLRELRNRSFYKK